MACTLGAPVTEPQGNSAPNTSLKRGAGAGAGGHVRHHLQHGGQGLHVEQRGHLDRKRLGNARQVVAQQVDDHHVFGALFGRGHQWRWPGWHLPAAAGCHAARCLSWGGSGCGRLPACLVPVKKQLGRDRQHLLEAGVDKGRVAVGLGAVQALQTASSASPVKSPCSGAV